MITIYTMVNGEQIIGAEKPSWESATTQTLISNPYYIVEMQDEMGNNGLKLINVCTFSDQQYIVVDNKNIVFGIPANDTMSKYYTILLETYSKTDTTKVIEEAIKDMEDNMEQIIAQRFLRGSTIN